MILGGMKKHAGASLHVADKNHKTAVAMPAQVGGENQPADLAHDHGTQHTKAEHPTASLKSRIYGAAGSPVGLFMLNPSWAV